MKNKKRSRLPRGLRWKSDSPYIWFSWRDSRGKQHQQSTETDDPVKAFGYRTEFLERQKTGQEEVKSEEPAIGKLPLREVAKLFFKWKTANSAAQTVAREERIFKPVEKFFGWGFPANAVRLQHIRDYQLERRKQISPTMKQPVTGRTVNYEMHLLRSALTFAGCWTAELETGYQPLREVKRRAGKVATKDQLISMIQKAVANEYWQVALYCAAVAAGTGCRGGEIRQLQLSDIDLDEGKIRVVREIAKNRTEREPRLMALADWGLRNLLIRAQALGAKDPQHYLLPLSLSKSRHPKDKKREFNVTKPMITWVKSWRKLTEACGMAGFRFHDLRHTFRTLGAEAGVPLEVMMAQLGHMDRETSLEYVHIQQKALDRAKQMIEAEQSEVLTAAYKVSSALQEGTR